MNNHELYIQFYFDPKGVEEVVALDFVSVKGGKAYSAIGDYDGFIHSKVDEIGIQYEPNMGSTAVVTVGSKNARVVQDGEKNKAYYIGDVLIVNDKQVKCPMNTPILGKKEWGTGHNFVIKSYYDCVKKGTQFANDYVVGANVVRAILAMYKSKGKEIKLTWEK